MTREGVTHSTWWLLASRLVFCIAAQLLLTVSFHVAGVGQPFASASAWWLALVTAGNGVTLFTLWRLRRDEGGLRSLWKFSRPTWKADLGWFLVVTVLAGPIGWLPNVMLAKTLWAAPDTGNAVLFRPLPTAALVVLAVAFPVTQALAELPAYLGHVMPKLRAAGWPASVVVLVPSFFLSAQHVAMPLQLDWRFVLWRGLMFLPFAVLVGAVVFKRPTLLPYLLIVHALMDAQLPLLTWLVSSGALTFAT